MDGRRRIAEPVTGGPHGRPAGAAAPAFRRDRARSGLRRGSARLGRFLRRWLGPVQSWSLPRGTGIAAAGFRITSIAMAGQNELTREEVLTIAGITGRTSLLFLDAADARTKLLANPWIAEANVLKLYPSRLHMTVTER